MVSKNQVCILLLVIDNRWHIFETLQWHSGCIY